MSSRAVRLVALLFSIGLVACTRSAPPAVRSAQHQQAPRPNILFAIADDASLHMGAYGTRWVKSPAFDRVARDGLLFERAYTPNAKCAPSRAAILTGRNSWQLEEAANHLAHFPAKFRTYVEALEREGYFVGRTGKGWAPGDAGLLNGRPRELAGPRFDERRAQPPTDGISKNDYAANFEDFLSARPKNRPWCFWYGSSEPHRRYEFGSGARKGGKKPDDIDRVPRSWPDEPEVRQDMLDYALEIEHFDAHLGRMLSLLEASGELHNTLVVVTSDNGMPFPRVKGNSYEQANHLPLAIMWPDGVRAPGRKIADFVSFVDFAPTFLEVAGTTAEASGMQPTSGRSLVEIFRSEKAGQVVPSRDFVLLGKERHDAGRPHDAGYPIRGIVQGNWLYLHNYEPERWPSGNPETGYLNTDGSPTKSSILERGRKNRADAYWQGSFGKRPPEELYDLRTDPDCLTNVAEDPGVAAHKQALAARMETRLRAQGDPRMNGRGAIFDAYEIAHPESRGYYERFMAQQAGPASWVNASDYERTPLD